MGKRKTKTEKFFDSLATEQAEEVAFQITMRDKESNAKLKAEKSALRKRVHDLELAVEDYAEVAEMVTRLRSTPGKPHKMKRTERKSKIAEGIVGLLLSDLHLEEEVDPLEVNGLNKYNLEIAIDRCDRLMTGFRWYLDMVRAKYKVRKLFVPLLGDNVTNELRAEDCRANFLSPFEAVVFARQRAIQIYDQLLAVDDIVEIFAPIIPGNHDRMPGTRKNPHSKRTKFSLAYLLADGLREHYRDEPRIKFELSHAAHHYSDIFGRQVRSCHGDGFRYNKGVGGIYVSARRYIKELNSTIPAPLTVFGHHHQFKTDADWVSNGSLIGYSEYAANNAFPFEPAGQVAFTIDRDRGKRLAVLLQVQEDDTWT